MPVDKQILIEYADMKEEIKDLRRRIQEDKKALDRLNKTVVTDSVTCGKKGKKPLRTVKIHGKPTMAIIRKQATYERKIAQLELLEADLLEKQTQVEEYIQQIEKSRLRIMFRLCPSRASNRTSPRIRTTAITSLTQRERHDTCICG